MGQPEPCWGSLRSEEHTSELQSRPHLVCRLLLEKKKEACREAATSALGYGDPRGVARPRKVIAGYVGRVRGAAVDPDRIVICAGYAQGLALTLRALADAGVFFF